MQAICSQCRTPIEADQINIGQLVGKCPTCETLVQVQLLREPAAKPAESRIQEATMSDGSIGLLLPPQRSLAWFLVIFGSFWDLMTGGMLVSILTKDSSFDLFGLLFMIPFLLVGTAFLLSGVAMLNLTTAVIIGKADIKLIRKVFGREFIKSITRDAGMTVDKVVRYTQNDVPVHGARITNGGGQSLTFGQKITDQEIAWLDTLVQSH